MYLPKKPVAPNTVATMPLKEERPPAPFFVTELTHLWSTKSITKHNYELTLVYIINYI